MKSTELKDKNAQQLQDMLLELKREQFNLRMQVRAGQSTNTSRLNGVRKDIARIKTQVSIMKKEGSKA